MGTAKKDAKPSKDFSTITQNGLAAHALGTKHQAALEARLEPTLLADLAADLTSLGTYVPGAKQAHATAQAATANQDKALVNGHALVTAVRTAVTRLAKSPAVRAAYGVGVKVSPKVVKDVKAAIGLIVDRATKEPAEAKSLGILPKDVTALNAAMAAITEADSDQETKRANAPLSTKARNETANRVQAATDRIISAGVVEFAHDATVRGQFEALIGRGNSAAKVKEKVTEQGAAPEGEAKKPTEG